MAEPEKGLNSWLQHRLALAVMTIYGANLQMEDLSPFASSPSLSLPFQQTFKKNSNDSVQLGQFSPILVQLRDVLSSHLNSDSQLDVAVNGAGGGG